MLFTTFVGILLLSQLVLTSQKDCATISPRSYSDCKLSSSDREEGYIYCCYEEFLGFKGCYAFDEDGYEQEKEAAELIGDSATFICNEANFRNLSFIILIMLILLNL